jgi:hypothetical protein
MPEHDGIAGFKQKNALCSERCKVVAESIDVYDQIFSNRTL